MLERLRRALDAQRARLAELLRISDRDLTPEEQREFDAMTAAEGAESIPALEARIATVEEAEQRAQRAQAAIVASGRAGDDAPVERGSDTTVRVGAEPETYRRGGSQSYFRDLTLAQIRQDRSAFERLERNRREYEHATQERALSTTDSAGGDFVPPLWMVNEYIELARAGRVTADLVRKLPLPGGTDSINLPKIATGTAVAEQSTQNTPVQNTDATTSGVTANVATLAGQQVVAVQLIEQSPINMDEILLGDLAADYAIKADVFVLNNNAAGKRGLLFVSGVNAVTYTDASPTLAELWPKLADGIAQIHTGRLMPGDAIVMHPRRWAWMTAAVDSTGRPLIGTGGQSVFNAMAQAGANVSQGWVANIQGVDVYVDPNIPINLGAGTNEDRIIILRRNDVIFFEGNPKAEAFRETKAAELSVLLRFYNYAALQSERQPKAITVISGTGLVTPTF